MQYNLADVYEDAFDKCLNTLYSCIIHYEEKEYSFYTYFLKSLNNKLYTIKKTLSKKRARVTVEETLLENSYAVDELPISRLFDGLNEKELLVLKLMCFEKKTAKSISDEYGISLYSIYSTLKRAKEKVRKNI